MTSAAILRSWARNNMWANHRLLGACGHLSADELHAQRTSFFPTIMKTLNHILIVDWYYVDALVRGGRGRSAYEVDEPFAELAPLHAAQLESDRTLLAWVETASDAALETDVDLERADHIQRERAVDVLLHLFQHQIHHRGQVHAMLSGTRVAPPQLDEFFLREELPLRRTELDALGLPPQ